MGLGIRFEDLRHDQFKFMTDDRDASFMSLCARAPWDSLRRGVAQYGETMFNSLQARRLVEELESLPEQELTPTIRDVLDGARQTIVRSGYIQFVGD